MKIHVKESTMIRPAKETPNHFIRTSDLDLLGREIHISTVYFFRRRPNNSSKFFEDGLLKEALSKVLVPFYPMAGRLGRDESGRIEIQCNGEGVLFKVAKTSCVIDDFADFSDGYKLLQLVPTVDYTKPISSYPLVMAQVTHFRCQGVCLGVAFHHVFGDASSKYHFINTWAEMTRGLPISTPPFFDRTILGIGVPTSPVFRHIEYDPPPSMNTSTQSKESQSNPEFVTNAIIKLSADQINILKAKSQKDHGSDTTKYSRFEILAAHIWRCMCKARGLPNDQASKLYIPTDGRSRLNPPLPSGYIGNVIFTTSSLSLSSDIQSEPLNYTVERIHKALKRRDDEYLKSALAYLKQQRDLSALKRGAHTFKCPNLNISNLLHAGICDTDFGWGRPMFVRPIIGSEGVVQILPSPTNDGSLLVVINLETHHMQLFKKLFYEIFVQCKNARSRY